MDQEQHAHLRYHFSLVVTHVVCTCSWSTPTTALGLILPGSMPFIQMQTQIPPHGIRGTRHLHVPWGFYPVLSGAVHTGSLLLDALSEACKGWLV